MDSEDEDVDKLEKDDVTTFCLIGKGRHDDYTHFSISCKIVKKKLRNCQK